MSVIRIFRWTCDFCGLIHEKAPYREPEHWVILKADVRKGLPIHHACPDCAKEASKDREIYLPD